MISELVGFPDVLYSTPSEGTFYFIVTYEAKIVKFLYDARDGWIYGAENDKIIFQFKPAMHEKLYIDRKDVKVLNFEGKYATLAPDGEPGAIKMGLDSLRSAFQVIQVFDGSTHCVSCDIPDDSNDSVNVKSDDAYESKGSADDNLALPHAFGTFVIYLSEANKFHRVFQCCCKSVVYKSIHTLDSYDQSLGIMVKKWGKLCLDTLEYLVECLRQRYKPEMSEKMKRISDRMVPGINSVQDVIDNICIWTYGSTKDKKPKTKDKKPKTTGTIERVWSPMDFSPDDPDVAAIIRHYRKKVHGGGIEAFQLKRGEIQSGSLFSSNCWRKKLDADKTVVEFVEKQKTALFKHNTWSANLAVQNVGALISRSSVGKLTNSGHITSSTNRRHYATAAVRLLQYLRK